jgi:hypothetical protein
LYSFSSFSKRILASFSVLLVCVSGVCASTTKSRTRHVSKPVPKTSSAKPAEHTVNHSTHSSTSKRVAPKTASGVKASRTSSHSKGKGKIVHSKAKQTAHSRGQQGIDAERARAIQEALIRAKYLDGEPSGVWDQKTKDALTRLQMDNGWQSKVVPDSRALIKLGLGPNHDNVINPETSGITSGPVVGSAPAVQLQPGGGTSNR